MELGAIFQHSQAAGRYAISKTAPTTCMGSGAPSREPGRGDASSHDSPCSTGTGTCRKTGRPAADPMRGRPSRTTPVLRYSAAAAAFGRDNRSNQHVATAAGGSRPRPSTVTGLSNGRARRYIVMALSDGRSHCRTITVAEAPETGGPCGSPCGRGGPCGCIRGSCRRG